MLMTALRWILVCTLAWQASAVNVPPSRSPPGGLAVADTPQFILFSHDDNTNSRSTRFVLEVTDARKNPNGCRVPVTWFTCTTGCQSDCKVVKQLYDQGHEIAVHTVTHRNMAKMSLSTARREVVNARSWISKCGVPASNITGFRTPFLASSRRVRQVLSEAGLRYDSTMATNDAANRSWPATWDNGPPYDCIASGNTCTADEKYPGRWELPLVSDTTGGWNLMDYCTNEMTGAPRSNCSALAQLKTMFLGSYTTNRAPITVGVHSTTTGYLANSKFRREVGRFLDWALAKKDVWAVTTQQLLDWMENPVPAANMTAFMSRYTCSPAPAATRG